MDIKGKKRIGLKSAVKVALKTANRIPRIRLILALIVLTVLLTLFMTNWGSASGLYTYQSVTPNIVLSPSDENAASVVIAPSSAVKAFHSNDFSDSSQVITVTANGMNTSSASLNTYEKTGGVWNLVLTASAFIGRDGLVYDAHRIESDNKTPAGIYGFAYAFGSEPNPGTKLQYRQSDDNSYFDENSGSPNYNRWVETDPGGNSEFMKIPQYKYGLVIDFNPDQTPDKGSGIFLHIRGNYDYTDGCVSLSETNVVSILEWLDSAKKPKILICSQSDLSKYYY